jgi:hypothetical protein
MYFLLAIFEKEDTQRRNKAEKDTRWYFGIKD